MLNDDQLLRFSRQILLAGWDIEAQEKLFSARVLMIGMGGLCGSDSPCLTVCLAFSTFRVIFKAILFFVSCLSNSFGALVEISFNLIFGIY